MDCLRLRVQDIDFARDEILVRDAKKAKDRTIVLPGSLKALLQNHLDLHPCLRQAGMSSTVDRRALAVNSLDFEAIERFLRRSK